MEQPEQESRRSLPRLETDFSGVQTPADLARLLRTLRRRQARSRGGSELTYRELAARTGWSHGVIGDYLTGKTLPSTERFDVLTQLLGATVAEQGALATVRDRVEEQRRTRAAPRVGPAAPVGADPADAPDPRGPVDAAPAVHVPRALPVDLAGFVGRESLLRRLDRLLEGVKSSVQIAVLSGTAGVGKTTVAVHWAHRVADRFPDGQLFMDLRGFGPSGHARAPVEVLGDFLGALGVPAEQIPASLDCRVACYRSVMADRQMLVVLDNARDAEQVRPLLPGRPGSAVLVTSRRQLPAVVASEGADPVAVGLLSTAEARELLTRRLGRERLANQQQAVDEIVEGCARLPLALAVVSARAAAYPGFPLAELVPTRDIWHGLKAFDCGDRGTDIQAVLSWSYRSLSEPAARLFRLLGLHPGPDVGIAAVASLGGAPADDVRPVLTELLHAHLVEERAPGRFALHDLLRCYAAELAGMMDGESARRTAIGRLHDHYLRSAYAAALSLSPHRSRLLLPPPQHGVAPESFADLAQSVAWFTAERVVLVNVVEQAAAAGYGVPAWQLASASSQFLERRGHWHELISIQQAALAAARRLDDRAGCASAHRGLGRGFSMLGQLDQVEIHLQHAIQLSQEQGDQLGLAYAYHQLALAYGRSGRHHAALNHGEQALARYREVGHGTGTARALNVVGWSHGQLGDYHACLKFCEQAIAIQRGSGDREGEAVTADSLGYAHHRLGAYRRAAVWYRHAVRLHRLSGDCYLEASSLVELGESYAIRDPVSAGRCWQRAAELFTELGDPRAEEVREKLLPRLQPAQPVGGAGSQRGTAYGFGPG